MTTPFVVTLASQSDACLGGLYSDCAHSPVTNVSAYAGSVENQVFFELRNPAVGWTNSEFQARSAISIDGSINAVALSLDGSVTACALTPSDEGSELHVIKTPAEPATAPLGSIKIFTSSTFPIRTLCFGFNGRLKTKLFLGTDEGKVVGVSIGRGSSNSAIFQPNQAHGGVKCVRTCALTGQVAASFCDGYLLLFDSAGAEVESKRISKKPLLPDSMEKFALDWHPKQRLLAVAGLPVPAVLKAGVWATTPLPDAPVGVDGVLSTVKWGVDGTLLAGVTCGGTISIFDFSPITGPELKIRAISASTTVISLCMGYVDGAHVVNAIGLKGERTALFAGMAPEVAAVLKKGLKIEIAALLQATKETAMGNMESGLVEEEEGVEEKEEGSSSSDDSDSGDSEMVESVDESPEQLREELAELMGDQEKKGGKEVVEEGEDDEDDEEGDRRADKGDRAEREFGKPNLDRQFSFQPGASSVAARGGVTRRLLCWNQFGSVVRTDRGEEGLIEVVLETDAAPLRQFRLKDNLHKWALASLSSSGLALAVKSRFDMTDKYEDDLVEKADANEDELTGGLSKVCFRPFTSWANQREWIVPLPAKAEVEGLAAGSTVVAAIATDSTVRIWAAEGGFFLHQFCLSAEVPIAIAATDDSFLAVSAMRSRSTESMQFQSFGLKNFGAKLALFASGSLPVSASAGTALCWVGVSEETVPFTCDTQGVVRGLFPTLPEESSETVKFLWTPLLNFVSDVQKRGEGYWPLFVSEKAVWCVATRAEDEYEPRTAPLPPKLNIPLRPQGQYVSKEEVSGESQLMLDRLLLQQQRWLGVEVCEKAHDKRLAETFRKLLETGKLEKALGAAALAFGAMTSRLMVRMAAALGLRTLETRLEDLFNPQPVGDRPVEQVSAAASLFPNRQEKNAKTTHTIASPPEVTRAPPAAPPAPSVGARKANPFAKKRKPEEELASPTNEENKIPRNA